MASWSRLGMNLFGEWIEEDSSSNRRVFSISGYLPEPSYLDLRWGRVQSSEDAILVAEGLSRSDIFSSYGSLSKACAVWTCKKGSVTPERVKSESFKVLVENAMASRVWGAVLRDCWSHDLPDWTLSIQRLGLSSWPLALDIGIYRKHYKVGVDDNFISLNNFKIWLDKKISKKEIVIKKTKDGYIVNVGLDSYVLFGAGNNKTSLENFAGEHPALLRNETWSDTYIPFSSLEGERSSYSGYVDPLLYQAMLLARPNLTASQVRKELSSLMSIDEDKLNDVLSDEQLDAIFLAYQNLSSGGSFLLADETGYGKGRILAAISKVALKMDIRIVFITEKKALLSDFYRDCLSVFGDKDNIPLPSIIHTTAKVLDASGKSLIGKDLMRLPIPSDKWVWTTYSQFNRAKPDKLKALISWIKGKKTWILMDESQNAAGDSKTGESLKEFTQNAQGTIYSSATYAKREEQLDAYRTLFSGSNDEWKRLKSAFVSDNNTLRSAITLSWAEQGIFLRREHPPMDNPDPLWIQPSVYIVKEQELFANWWIDTIRCAQIWTKSLNKGESPWARLGGSLSRASREFSLLQKKDEVIEFAVNNKKINDKSVVVSDWTLSSHMQRMCSLDVTEEDTKLDGDGDSNTKKLTSKFFSSMPLWKDSWDIILTETFSDIELSTVGGPSSKNMKDARDKARKSLSMLPDWSVSPFDDIIMALNDKGIKVSEISGRQLHMVKDGDGWLIKPKPEENRVISVSDFNSGKTDMALLTRAGNSGISLHAGEKFKDQRRRHLLEWDVSPDPSVRLQFWGRVRRKDQVCEPKRSTLLIDSTSERRRLNRDSAKQGKLSSHSGYVSKKDDISWIGKEGSIVAQEWISNNPTIAKVLGSSYEFDVEKALLRSVILKQEDRDNLMLFLDRGVSLFSDWSVDRLDQFNMPSRVIRENWWWGKDSNSLHWEERVWPARKSPSKEMVFEELSKHSNGLSLDAKTVFSKWRSIWKSWWSISPSCNTEHRREMLQWWLTYGMAFDRGKAVEIKDPHTGARVRAIVLGFEAPPDDAPENWSASQIGMWVWPVSMVHPMKLSLTAWMSEEMAALRPIQANPSPSWFKETSIPTKALVLTGPSWSIAAWGIRQEVKGELIHIQNEDGKRSWGWKMPEWWTWQDMILSDRELSGINQVMLFLKEKTNEAITWRWSDQESIHIQPQFGGIVVTGNYNTVEKITYPIQRKCGSKMSFDNNKGLWTYIVPWRRVMFVFMSWFGSGAIPTISHKHKDWHKKTWDKKK